MSAVEENNASIRPVRSLALSALLMILALTAAGEVSGGQGKKLPDHDIIKRGRIKALELVSSGDYEKAVSFLNDLHDRYPEHQWFTELLANTYLRNREPEKAADLLEKEIEAFPGRVKYSMILGKAYLDIGLTDKAVETWNGILRRDSSRPSDFTTVARMEWEAGLFETAIETLREVIGSGRYLQKLQQRSIIQELIRYETLYGDYDAAFTDGLALFDAWDDPIAANPGFLLEAFRNSSRKGACISSVDSLSSVSMNNKRFFSALKGLLLFESARYEEAEKALAGMALTGKEMYFVSGPLLELGGIHGAQVARGILESLISDFSERDPDSPVAAQIFLSMAEAGIEAVRANGSAPEMEKDEIVRLLDKAIRHRYARQHGDRARLLKAGFLVDQMRKPREALSTLQGTGFVSAEDIREKARIEAFSLLGCRDPMAEERFEEMSSHPDSVIAALGKFASATLSFLDGEFEKAMTGYSKLAEEYPSSDWANDALDMAIMIKKSLKGHGGSLILFSKAAGLESRGEFDEAVSVLDSMIADFPGSPAVAKGVYLKARILELKGDRGSAGEALLWFSEEYPLGDRAPEALEKLAVMVDADFPDSSAAILGKILERYPEYVFISRIREKYISANRAKEEKAIRPEGGR